MSARHNHVWLIENLTAAGTRGAADLRRRPSKGRIRTLEKGSSTPVGYDATHYLQNHEHEA